MNTDKATGVALAKAVAEGSASAAHADVAVCPPYVYLDAISQVVGDSSVALGAQDVYFENDGAYTGEISTTMLNDIGCQYIILGHSERRHVLGETDELINKKVHKTLEAGLLPILCIGELLSEREAGKTMEVCRTQIEGSLQGISAEQMAKITIAYEPVWAIGTGKVATPEQAEEVHGEVRQLLASKYDQATADVVRIQYGGSVKPDNAKELLGQPNIDGALVGGASLTPEAFLGIINAAKG